MSTSSIPFIRYLLSAITNATLYGMEHPQVRRLLDEVAASLRASLSEPDGLALHVIDNETIINGKAQPTSIFLSRFASLLSTRGVGHVKFTGGCTPQELSSLVHSLSLSPDRGVPVASTEHIRLGRIEVRMDTEDGGDAEGRRPVKGLSLQELCNLDISSFMDMYESVRRGKRIRTTGIFDMVAGIVEALRPGGKTLTALTVPGQNDENGFTHSASVAVLTIAQAMALGIEDALLHDIGVAALLHDVGKLFVPEEILLKREALTSEELGIMREHPVRGARCLIHSPGVPRLAVKTTFEHHLKYDRTGYPTVSWDWPINSCSHMIMLSDFFDISRSRRSSGEPAAPHAVCAAMLELAGTDFHPVFTRNFHAVVSRLYVPDTARAAPVGSGVENAQHEGTPLSP